MLTYNFIELGICMKQQIRLIVRKSDVLGVGPKIFYNNDLLYALYKKQNLPTKTAETSAKKYIYFKKIMVITSH